MSQKNTLVINMPINVQYIPIVLLYLDNALLC